MPHGLHYEIYFLQWGRVLRGDGSGCRLGGGKEADVEHNRRPSKDSAGWDAVCQGGRGIRKLRILPEQQESPYSEMEKSSHGWGLGQGELASLRQIQSLKCLWGPPKWKGHLESRKCEWLARGRQISAEETHLFAPRRTDESMRSEPREDMRARNQALDQTKSWKWERGRASQVLENQPSRVSLSQVKTGCHCSSEY